MLQQVDDRRRAVSGLLAKEAKAALGQYFTPQTIAGFMARLFRPTDGESLSILDAGAGIGSLSASLLAETLQTSAATCYLTAFEVDRSLVSHLTETLQAYQELYRVQGKQLTTDICNQDYVEQAVKMVALGNQKPRFDLAILNPPYKKIHSSSQHSKLLRKAGIKTVNLYTGFLWLAIEQLKPGGQLVGIVPRSFCNGPYYRPFREFLLSAVSIEHIHLFDARNKAFGEDEVLQENVILHVIKGKHQGKVTLSASHDATFSDYHEWTVPFSQIVKPKDRESFIFISSHQEESVYVQSDELYHSVAELDCQVSTGPVVDFRVKPFLHNELKDERAALIYPAHFNGWTVHHPVPMGRKFNTIDINERTERQLFPTGFYTLVRRFSAKEEKRRIVARVFRPQDIKGELVGFENHLNVYHHNKQGIEEELAFGLATFLNSAVVDDYFRLFSGHTQVNATDLKQLKYPSRERLCELGRWAKKQKRFDLVTIDKQVRTIL